MEERTEIFGVEELGGTEFSRSGGIVALAWKIIHGRGINRLVDHACVEAPVHSDPLTEDVCGRLSQHGTAVTHRAFRHWTEKRVAPTLLSRRRCKVVQV